jgi:ubiquitin-associated SH3 domain-containing protein
LIDFAEPGLFEWLAWYQDGMPDWMSGEELVAAGYNIQLAYKPYISAEELQESTESCQQFYIRNFFVTQCALQVRLWHTHTALCRAESTLRTELNL